MRIHAYDIFAFLWLGRPVFVLLPGSCPKIYIDGYLYSYSKYDVRLVGLNGTQEETMRFETHFLTLPRWARGYLYFDAPQLVVWGLNPSYTPQHPSHQTKPPIRAKVFLLWVLLFGPIPIYPSLDLAPFSWGDLKGLQTKPWQSRCRLVNCLPPFRSWTPSPALPPTSGALWRSLPVSPVGLQQQSRRTSSLIFASVGEGHG